MAATSKKTETQASEPKVVESVEKRFANEIEAKMAAGLSRSQAIDVVKAQVAYDAANKAE